MIKLNHSAPINFKERDLQEILELEYNKNKKTSRKKTLEKIYNFLESKYKK